MVTPGKLLSNGAMETWKRHHNSKACQGATHLPIWGEKRLETGLPSQGRQGSEIKNHPLKERLDTELGEKPG